MGDESKEPEGRVPGSTQPGEEEDPELREVSEDELKEILAAYEKWLKSDGTEGEKADLRHADLREADLRRAKGLTDKQLDLACGNDNTKLLQYLKDYKIKPCPKKK